MSKWEDRLKIYDNIVAKCPRFERKGMTIPYTSANGHMFSQLNKAGDLGIRFSEEIQENISKNLIPPSSDPIIRSCTAMY